MGSKQVSQRTVSVTAETVELYASIRYRGKTGGYFREETSIEEVVNKAGQSIRLAWGRNWKEIAPGIRTRTSSTDSNRSDTQEAPGEVRKYELQVERAALPVRVRMRTVFQFIDYSDDEFSSSEQGEEWVEYTADSTT